MKKSTTISHLQLGHDHQGVGGTKTLPDWGGVIVKTVNKKEGTLLEPYQTKLDRDGEPVQINVSEGSFLALYEELVDSSNHQQILLIIKTVSKRIP